jgi:hypothetical protein
MQQNNAVDGSKYGDLSIVANVIVFMQMGHFIVFSSTLCFVHCQLHAFVFWPLLLWYPIQR